MRPKGKRQGHSERKCENRFLLISSSSKVDRFSQTKTTMIAGPFHTYRRIHFTSENASFLADRTNGRAYATVLRLSVVRRLSSVTLCIVAKRCVLEQKLLLKAYRKSYVRNRLVPK